MLGNYSCFCRCLLTFSKKYFFQKFHSGTLESNFLDPDQDRNSVGPGLGPNCLPRLSADDKMLLLAKESVIDVKTLYDDLCEMKKAHFSS